MNEVILSCLVLGTYGTNAAGPVQDASIKELHLDQLGESFAKDLQKKYVPNYVVKTVVYTNVASDLLLKKQISFQWRF